MHRSTASAAREASVQPRGQAARSGGILLTLALVACGGVEERRAPADSPWAGELDASARVAVLSGFDGPEAVHYDADQDVWFVSNFTGNPGEADGNGFVSRVAAEDGTLLDLRFAVGTEDHPFHAGRGMSLHGDTLWVADLGGIHAFHRETGDQLGFVDLTSFEPGFLNDIAVGPDGSAYVTDTGVPRVIRFHPGPPEVTSTEGPLGAPNGILWDASRGAFWLAPWTGGEQLRLWNPRTGEVTLDWSTPGAGNMDGMVLWDGQLLVASQADSSIHAVSDTRNGPLIRTLGPPADLGIDTRRGRLAIPEVALDQVEIWQLPGGSGE